MLALVSSINGTYAVVLIELRATKLTSGKPVPVDGSSCKRDLQFYMSVNVFLYDMQHTLTVYVYIQSVYI